MIGSRTINALLTSEGHCILPVYGKRTHIPLGNVIVDTVLSVFPVFHETIPLVVEISQGSCKNRIKPALLLFIIRPKPVKLLFHLIDDLGSFLVIPSSPDFFRCKPQSLVVSFQLVELSNPVYKRFGLIYLSYIIGSYELSPDVSQTVDMVYINDIVIKEDVASRQTARP